LSTSWRVAAAASFAMFAVFWAWAWAGAAKVVTVPWWWLPALLSLPMLPPAIAFLLRRRRAPLWAGIVALLYFCHGIGEFHVSGSLWPALETALALVIVFAAGWPGIAAKMAKRRAASPPNV
jgi:uncharacterized membrane protein